MSDYTIHNGDEHSDNRGLLRFFNDLELNEVVRFYEITPKNTEVIRAWQGHQLEKKWFYCQTGSFVINLVNFIDEPSKQKVRKVHLEAHNPQILEIKGGVANGFKATSPNSKLLIFSNFTLNQSKKDDHRFPIETWDFED